MSTRVRWTVCALLFFGTTVNYLDRQLFPVLERFFEDDMRLGPTDYALINVSFLLTYGFGMVFIGRGIDRVGVRKGLGVTSAVWNLASMAHALVGGIGGFLWVRAALGLGEAGNFPSAVRAVAEWFPKRERALATGWFNAGSNMGAILAPLLGLFIADRWGWRTCFLLLGGLGFVWTYFWLRLYRSPELNQKVNAAELELIRSDQEPALAQPSYLEVLGMRPLYSVAAAKFFSDAPWWFYLTWLPKFLTDEFKLSTGFMMVALPVVYIAADAGSVAGGWLSSKFISMGRPVASARRLAMLVCALCALPVISVPFLVDSGTVLGVPSLFLAIGAVSLAAAAHQGWSCNLFTVASDTLPKSAVAMAVGVMTLFGVIGAALFQLIVGRFVELTGSYLVPFAAASGLYLVALLTLLPAHRAAAVSRPAHPVAVFAGAAGLVACLAALQAVICRPPYVSLSDYESKRPGELKSESEAFAGPSAKVGWMAAQWFLWRPASTGSTLKGPKLELVKFDRADRPIVESKGVKAVRYVGPSTPQVAAYFGISTG